MLSLILAAFIGALVGASVYQCLSLLVRHARRPRLEFEIRSEAPFVVAATHNEAPAGVQATWIRVRIYNYGRRSAKSCRVYLMDLTKEGDKLDEVILQGEALPLWASSGGDGGIDAPLTISQGFGRYFDIAYFHDRDELKIPSSQYQARTPNRWLRFPQKNISPGLRYDAIAIAGLVRQRSPLFGLVRTAWQQLNTFPGAVEPRLRFINGRTGRALTITPTHWRRNCVAPW